MSKRIVFVIGFIPALLYAFARWVATGRDPIDVFDSFTEWMER